MLDSFIAIFWLGFIATLACSIVMFGMKLIELLADIIERTSNGN